MKKIIERYKDVHGLKTDEQVANRMGLSKSAFSNQKSREMKGDGSFNYKLLLETCDPDVNFNYILKGVEPKRISSFSESEQVNDVEQKFSTYEASLNELSNADIPQDELSEFVIRQQELLLDLLRSRNKKDLNS